MTPSQSLVGTVGSSGIAASDVIRSMMREGFSNNEIYDVLTGIGLYGEQVQLLIDRVAAEFHEARLEPRTSRLGAEMGRLFAESFEELKHWLGTQMDTVSQGLELVKVELEKMGKRVVDLQSVVIRSHGLPSRVRSECKLSKAWRCKDGEE